MEPLPPDTIPAATLDVTLNGAPRRFEGPMSVAGLLERLELPLAHVAVELNGELIPRRLHATTPIGPGDRVEVVTLVGGG